MTSEGLINDKGHHLGQKLMDETPDVINQRPD
jgi:hypothetical protein